VLNVELARVRDDEPTPKMLSMLELSPPSIDWVKIAEGMGVSAVAVATAEAFHAEFEQAMAQPGPRLIEATIVQNLQPLVDLIQKQRQAS
jgi:acetolactate synthase-1/2/3 large subunit